MGQEHVDARRELSQDLLRVYEHALGHCELGVAEHVLRALEELALSDRGCRAALDRAYLRLAAGRVNA